VTLHDRHLLNLMDEKRADAKAFRQAFPQIVILSPDAFARQLRAEEKE
jgi:hypothetical protein